MWGCDWVGSGWRAWVFVGRVLRFASGLDSGAILLEEERCGPARTPCFSPAL